MNLGCNASGREIRLGETKGTILFGKVLVVVFGVWCLLRVFCWPFYRLPEWLTLSILNACYHFAVIESYILQTCKMALLAL
jgi:hypothetical protein